MPCADRTRATLWDDGRGVDLGTAVLPRRARRALVDMALCGPTRSTPLRGRDKSPAVVMPIEAFNRGASRTCADHRNSVRTMVVTSRSALPSGSKARRNDYRARRRRALYVLRVSDGWAREPRSASVGTYFEPVKTRSRPDARERCRCEHCVEENQSRPAVLAPYGV